MADIKCCPTCHRVEPRLSPLQRKVLPLADGTRTYREIAAQIGSTEYSAQAAITFLKAVGYPVRGLARGHARNHRKTRIPRMELDKMVALREQGKTWVEIGAMLGIRGSNAQSRAKRAAEFFGVTLPPDDRGRGRRPLELSASDYVRMRELRVEADLPWRMVGQAVGRSATGAAKHYKALCAIYDPNYV